MPIIDKAALLLQVEALNDRLLREATRNDASLIREVASADLNSSEFSRGFLLGVCTVLRCQGIPAFLSGPATDQMDKRLHSIFLHLKAGVYSRSAQ